MTDGRFLGVVAGSIRFSYFHELFGRLHLDPDDTITVLRRDGTIIMRTPFDLDVIGKNLADLRRWSTRALSEAERVIFRAERRRRDAAALSSGATARGRCRSWSAKPWAEHLQAFGARRRPGSARS